MTHATQLDQREGLIRSPLLKLWPFVRRRQTWILTISIILALSLYLIPTPNADTETVQTETVQVESPIEIESIVPSAPTMRDKMVEYMQKVNSTLGTETAYKLADAIIIQHERYKIPVALQLGLITVESHFDQYALSKAGAVGFYQVMPNWHADKVFDMLARGEIQTKNIYAPLTQAALGTKILSDCLRMHHRRMTRALQCYNGSTATTEYADAVMTHTRVAEQSIKI